MVKNSFICGILYGICLAFLCNISGQAEKKSLEIDAYKRWKRVESPNISSSGDLPCHTTRLQPEKRKEIISI